MAGAETAIPGFSRHSSVIGSPSKSRATKRRRSSITELSFHGIDSFPLRSQGKTVTHVSGTLCHLCLIPTVMASDPSTVIPAKAGIFFSQSAGLKKIPAFAGMTTKRRVKPQVTWYHNAQTELRIPHLGGLLSARLAGSVFAGWRRDGVYQRRGEVKGYVSRAA